MNCSICKDRLINLLDEEISMQEKNELLTHIHECAECNSAFEELKNVLEKLKPQVKIIATNDLKNKIIADLQKTNNVKQSVLMLHSKTWKKIIAIAAILIFVLIFIPILNKNGSPDFCSAQAAQNIFDKYKNSLLHLKTIYLKFKIRTLESDNFEYIDISENFVEHHIWKQFGEVEKWKIEKPGRTVLMDGKNSFMYIENSEFGYKGPVNCGFVESLKILLDPAMIMDAEKKFAEKNKAEYILQENNQLVILTVKSKALGDFKNDYLLNSSVLQSNNRRVYTFGKFTGLLRSMQVYVEKNNYETLVINIGDIQYNKVIPENVFAIETPKNMQWKDVAEKPSSNSKEFANITSNKAAELFFESCATENWEKVRILYPYLDKSFKKMFGKLKMVSLGKPFKSGLFPGEFVPYEIKLNNGEIIKMNLAIRNDNKEKIWQVDGGI